MSDTKYFSISQKRAIDSYNSRKNIFITGPAGVGKSYIISEIEKLSCSANRNIQVTATTGSAAALIGGKTIHSWGGIGMGRGLRFCALRHMCETKRWRFNKRRIRGNRRRGGGF